MKFNELLKRLPADKVRDMNDDYEQLKEAVLRRDTYRIDSLHLSLDCALWELYLFDCITREEKNEASLELLYLACGKGVNQDA